MTQQVSVTREAGHVLLIRLTRPEKKNALTGAMYDALTSALEEADSDEDIRAVVLAGSGGSFTAGNDLGDFLQASERPGGARPAPRFIRKLATLQTPLVAAIGGVAIGIGATLTLHCDLVYAAPNALFRMPFVDLGLVPEAGSSYLLPRRVGLARATELLMLAEPYDAAEALRLGLVNAIVSADRLLPYALEQAAKLSAKPVAALAATRALLRGDRVELERAMEIEIEAFTAALAGPEAQAAFRRFFDRSAPNPA